MTYSGYSRTTLARQESSGAQCQYIDPGELDCHIEQLFVSLYPITRPPPDFTCHDRLLHIAATREQPARRGEGVTPRNLSWSADHGGIPIPNNFNVLCIFVRDYLVHVLQRRTCFLDAELILYTERPHWREHQRRVT